MTAFEKAWFFLKEGQRGMDYLDPDGNYPTDPRIFKPGEPLMPGNEPVPRPTEKEKKYITWMTAEKLAGWIDGHGPYIDIQSLPDYPDGYIESISNMEG